jgi:hypothetical protein
LDLAARRLSVVERSTEVGGRLDTAAPKSKKARQVAIPRTVAKVLAARIEGSELDQVSDALDALTEGVGDAVYVQNMSTGPGPGSDRAP